MNTLLIGGHTIAPGEKRDIKLKISETYMGDEIWLPIRVIRSEAPGPTLLITAAVHGDEINGTGIIHDFMFGEEIKLLSGNLILVPVVNVFGFESQDRYLPDRRDLNRSFPGSETGSLAARLARILMDELVAKADYCIDLHSAASQRTNYPNIRGNLRDPKVSKLAKAFGCVMIVDGEGPEGSLRAEATKSGCPTIILEAGEPSKIEPTVLELGVRGIKNVLRHFHMLGGRREEPPFSAVIKRTLWLRAEVGGILRFHVLPGDLVESGQAVATNYSILGERQNILYANADAIVLSLTTMPAVKPGEPVCHLAVPNLKLTTIRRAIERASARGLYRRVGRDLGTSLMTSDF